MLILVKKLIGTPLTDVPILSYYLKLDNSLVDCFFVFGGEAHSNQ